MIPTFLLTVPQEKISGIFVATVVGLFQSLEKKVTESPCSLSLKGTRAKRMKKKGATKTYTW